MVVSRVYSHTASNLGHGKRMGSSHYMQFSLLLKKNITIVTRQTLQFALSLIVGFVICVVLVVCRAGIKPIFYGEPHKFTEIQITQMRAPTGDDSQITALAFCPNNDILGNVVKSAGTKLKLNTIPMATEDYLDKQVSINKGLVGVVFDESLRKIRSLPRTVKFKLKFPSKVVREDNAVFYEINWKTKRNYMIHYRIGPRDSETDEGELPPYIIGNFIAIQHAVSMSYIELLGSGGSNNSGVPPIVMQQLPFPPHTADEISQYLKWFYGLIITMFAFPCAHIGSILAIEKRKQFRLITAIMGIPVWIHWMAWFVCSFLYLMIFAVLLIIVLVVPIMGHAILSNMDLSLLIVFIVLYVCSAITFTFMFSAGFSRRSITYLMILLFWLVITTTIFNLIHGPRWQAWSDVILLCFYMNIVLGMAFEEILYHRIWVYGIHWDNIWLANSLNPKFCVGYALIALAGTSILYFFIALLIHKVDLGKNDFSEAWSFSYFWNKIQKKRRAVGEESRQYSMAIQTVDLGKHVGVKIQDLTKVFNNTVAVNNLSLKVYKNEVTVILSDYGGGKTTTVGLITGILTPTKGNIFINGENIKRNSKRAKSQIGYYPPFNYFFDELTVIETITLFSKLKGASPININNEIIKYTTAVGISSHLYSRIKNLPSPDKMKLAICNALCGGSKVILCDDPALDLDPLSKERIWNLLQMEKIGKTIIVFTSRYAQVDLFADRIGLMLRGSLKGYGDLGFLRKRLSGGYMLQVKKLNDDFSPENVLQFLSTLLPNIYMEEVTPTSAHFILSETNGVTLENALRELNNNLNNLNIKDFGLHLQTLEELMLSSGKDSLDTRKDLYFPDLELYTDDKLRVRQWRALMFKKFVYSTCYFTRLAAIVFTLGIVIAIANSNYAEAKIRHPKEYPISMDMIPGSKVFLETSNLARESLPGKIANEFEDFLKDHKFEKITEDFESFILEIEQTVDVHWDNLGAASIKEGKITAWFNSMIYHTPPLILNLIHNAIVRAVIGSDCLIEVVNAPAQISHHDMFLTQSNNWALFTHHYYALGMAFLIPLFGHEVLGERVSGFKYFILNSGVTSTTYWATIFIWDYFVYIIIAFILVLFLGCGESTSPYVMNKLGMYFLVFVVFGFCAIPMTYIICEFNRKESVIYVYSVIFNIMTGYVLWALTLQFRRNHSEGILPWIFKIFPHYNLAMSLEKVHNFYELNNICKQMCILFDICIKEDQCSRLPECCTAGSIFSFGGYGILWEFYYFFVVMVFHILLLWLFEYGVFSRTKFRGRKEKYSEPKFNSNSTREERIRILMLSEESLGVHPLVMDRVTKYYDEFLMLNQISIGLKEGEIFGLVGPHGCGKTTIFKILTGKVEATSGDVYFWGSRIDRHTAYGTEIGYGPQNSGLVDYLTGRDALHICGLIHGVMDKDIEIFCKRTAKYLGLTASLDKEIRSYDLNIKRKLGIAMAVIGNTSLIFLDQPTEACTPAAKMKIWDFIVSLNKAGRTIFFSSHSIIECFRTCDRIAVMVNGEIISIGTPEEHKQYVQSGIDVTVKTEGSDTPQNYTSIASVTRTKRLIERAYPEALLRVEHYGAFVYFIPYKGPNDWVDLVSLFEQNKEICKITSYFLNKSNIDVMFAQTAHRQKQGKYIKSYR